MNALKTGAAALAVVVGLVAIDFAGEYVGMLKTGFFQPRYEAIRRDTMINSRAYTEAEIRSLYNFKLQYMQATDEATRQVIVLAARHEASTFDRNRIPVDLRAWMEQVGILL